MSRYQKMQEKIVASLGDVRTLERGDRDGSRQLLARDRRSSTRCARETGFTVYGRWNSDEAFAEAFSLYRADPDACQRISPPVFAYFDAGRHARRRRERRPLREVTQRLEERELPLALVDRERPRAQPRHPLRRAARGAARPASRSPM